MYVVIRADGGPKIGYGHLVRTSAIASELLERGHDVTYATTTPEHVREVCPDGVGTETLPARDNPVPAREFVRDHADVTVTDSYLVDGAYQQRLRNVSPLVVIADDTRHAIAADVLVNGNLYAADLEYEIIGPQPEWCLGPDHLLLRSAITDYASKDPPWRETPKRAIVTMGGSDVAGMTPTVIQAFDGFELRVDAVVGPGCSARQEQSVRTAATETDADVRVTRDPDDLVERMLAADIGVSTASSTTYELLALGTPLVSIPVVDNQEPIATALRKRDAATVLQHGDGEAAFRSAVSSYLRNAELRRSRQQVGRRLVDGSGTERVAAVITDIP